MPLARRSLGIFAINLDRSPERWAAITERFGTLPWRLNRVRGLDARSEGAAVLAYRGLDLLLPPAALGWSLTRNRQYLLTEEACFVGHLMALQAFLASAFDLALILEDDARPRGAIEPALDDLAAPGCRYDVVKLEGIRTEGRRWAFAAGQVGNVQMIRSLRPSSGAAAYLLTRDAAAKLIRNAGRLLVPWDDYINSPSLTGCDTAQLSPWLIAQDGSPTTMATAGSRPKGSRQDGVASFWRQFRLRMGLRVGLWRAAWAGSPRRRPTRMPW